MDGHKPVLYESHAHTPMCKHALGHPDEYVAVARDRGLKGLIFTCHNPIPGGWAARVRMSPDEFQEYLELVARVRADWRQRMDVRLGMESEFVPGMEGWLEELHGRAEFNYILAGVHPQVREYMALYQRPDILDFQRGYFQHLAQAAETKLFDALAHPDIVKNLFPRVWRVALVLDEIKRCLDRIARTGVAIELNTSGLGKEVPEMNPGREILAEVRARNIPVVLGGDAHQPTRVGAFFPEALDLLGELGFTHVSVFLRRKRHDINIETARASLL